MDANTRTRKGGEGRVGSKDNKVLWTYGQETLNDKEERLLPFAFNHGLASGKHILQYS